MNLYTKLGMLICTALLLALLMQDRLLSFILAVVFLTIMSTKTAQMIACGFVLYVGKLVTFTGERIVDCGEGLSHGACNIIHKLNNEGAPAEPIREAQDA